MTRQEAALEIVKTLMVSYEDNTLSGGTINSTKEFLGLDETTPYNAVKHFPECLMKEAGIYLNAFEAHFGKIDK